MNKERLFTVGYSFLVEPREYLKILSRYKKNIHSVFVGLPELQTHVSLKKHFFFDETRGYEFLSLSKGLYKRYVPYNIVSYAESEKKTISFFQEKIYPYIEKYKIDGFILTHFDLARQIKKDFPHLEIQTSCNSYHWSIASMERWRKEVGVEVFNPPREVARTPRLLKELKEDGYKIKVLLNEACMYGCVHRYTSLCGNCMSYDLINALRTNFIPPSWLDFLDEYVDIYKLSGRLEKQEKVEKIYDSYILQKPIEYINDVIVCIKSNPVKILEREGIKIRESDLSKKLLTCENKFCYKGCTICFDKFKELIGTRNIKSYDVLEE